MIQKITENLYEISLKNVNAYLIEKGDELILIDTGSPGDEIKISKALAEIGRQVSDLTHIIVTHCHADHAGSLAALQKLTDAPTFMHRIDAKMVEDGRSKRPMKPGPGLLTKLLFRLFIAPAPEHIAPARVDHRIEDGELLTLAGGLRVIHTPGHSAGHIGLLWETQKVLFAADAIINQPRLNYMLGYEDFSEGKRSAAKLAQLDFDIACFGHGKPIIGNAAKLFRRKFADSKSKGSYSTANRSIA
ncbi:MAG: MBL fold metallo-hydrolase [Chloroflexota bacterium]